jgi:hypothetical protein
VIFHQLTDTTFAPDANETTQSLQEKFPATEIFSHIEVADGRVWLKPNGVPSFAGDLPEHEQKLVWATHAAPTADLFNQKVEGTAWRSKPSWYIVATKDQTIQPELERFVAKRMGATIFETDSSHVPIAVSTRVCAGRYSKSCDSCHGEGRKLGRSTRTKRP